MSQHPNENEKVQAPVEHLISLWCWCPDHPVVPTYLLKLTPSHVTSCSSSLLSSVEPTPLPLLQRVMTIINWDFFTSPQLLLFSFLTTIDSASWSLKSLGSLFLMTCDFLHLNSYSGILKTSSLWELHFFLPSHLPECCFRNPQAYQSDDMTISYYHPSLCACVPSCLA